jgi:Kdo2-lipid IVA lauroyltransferase/acyltransferase
MRILEYLAYAILRLALLPFRLVPLAVARLMGRGLGLAFCYLLPIRKNIVRGNLQIYHPEWDRQRLARGVREAYMGLGMAVAEFGWADKLTTANVADFVTLEGLEHYEAAHRTGRAVILYGGHQGMWEWAVSFPFFTGRPFLVVMKRIHNRYIDAYVTRRRAKFGVTAVSQRGAIKALADKGREDVDYGVFVDQRAANGKGVWIDVCGRAVAAMPGTAILAVRGGLPVMPIRIMRNPKGMTFRFHPVLDFVATGDEALDVQRLTQAINDPLTRWIGEQPAHYFWLHNRFKIHPAERSAAERWQAEHERSQAVAQPRVEVTNPPRS